MGSRAIRVISNSCRETALISRICAEAGAADDTSGRYLVLILEWPQVVTILCDEPLGGGPQCVRESLRHRGVGEIGRPPEFDFGGRQMDPQIRTQPVLHTVYEQAADVVH